MANQSTELVNHAINRGYGVSPPTVWTIVKGHIDTLVDKAIQRSDLQVADGETIMERFKLRFETLVKNPLSHVKTALSADRGFHIIHKEINGAVTGAVDSTMQELNMTGTNSSVKDALITSLDFEIEQDVVNQVYKNTTEAVVNNSNFFESLPIKDETIFVALVSMGIVIPIIFFTLLAIFIYKRHKEVENRRHEMLLRDQPEFSMDDYNPQDKSHFDEGVPDLDLKRLRV